MVVRGLEVQNKHTMKALFTLLFATLFLWGMMAQTNYNQAIKAAAMSEGSDAAICGMMELYGFDMGGDPFTQITTVDKLTAIFN